MLNAVSAGTLKLCFPIFTFFAPFHTRLFEQLAGITFCLQRFLPVSECSGAEFAKVNRQIVRDPVHGLEEGEEPCLYAAVFSV